MNSKVSQAVKKKKKKKSCGCVCREKDSGKKEKDNNIFLLFYQVICKNNNKDIE